MSGVGRREFLRKAALGTAAGVVGIGALAASNKAYAMDDGGGLIELAVKKIDQPRYMYPPFADADKLERFDSSLTAFNHPELQGGWQGGWPVQLMRNGIAKCKQGLPGFNLVDWQLSNAGWTSLTSMAGKVLSSWEPIPMGSPIPADVLIAQLGRWEGTPEENSRIIKKAAHLYTHGLGEAGVCKRNDRWMYSKDYGCDIVISDAHDKPVQEPGTWYIPETMDTMVVVIWPQYEPIRKYAGSFLSSSSQTTSYSLFSEVASKVAQFIRGLGYNAIPLPGNVGLQVPAAIDAGLGELGRHGLLIHPRFGSWNRFIRVLTDMPIAPDKPISFGAAEFCLDCLKCAEMCPSRSISFEKEPSYEVMCPSNNPGMKKWYVNTWSCLTYWVENGAYCDLCTAVCPFSKPQSWVHDLVKAVSGITPAFNPAFKKLDDVFGYGTTMEDYDPAEWWRS